MFASRNFKRKRKDRRNNKKIFPIRSNVVRKSVDFGSTLIEVSSQSVERQSVVIDELIDFGDIVNDQLCRILHRAEFLNQFVLLRQFLFEQIDLILKLKKKRKSNIQFCFFFVLPRRSFSSNRRFPWFVEIRSSNCLYQCIQRKDFDKSLLDHSSPMNCLNWRRSFFALSREVHFRANNLKKSFDPR